MRVIIIARPDSIPAARVLATRIAADRGHTSAQIHNRDANRWDPAEMERADLVLVEKDLDDVLDAYERVNDAIREADGTPIEVLEFDPENPSEAREDSAPEAREDSAPEMVREVLPGVTDLVIALEDVEHLLDSESATFTDIAEAILASLKGEDLPEHLKPLPSEKGGQESDPEPTPPEITLLDDFPAVDKLRGAGLSTVGDVRRFGDVTQINGIGDATAEKIAAALDELEA